MNIYENVKRNISLREAALRYGVEVGRGNMAICPFHNDHHPSLFVADDHYHCFACGEHGDVIDFVAKLLDCRPYEAAQRLAADFGIDPNDTGQASPTPANPSKLIEAQRFREQERQCFSVCMDYVRLLTRYKTEDAPRAAEDAPDDRFLEACRYLEQYEYYTEALAAGIGDERTQLVTYLTDSGILAGLQKRLRGGASA